MAAKLVLPKQRLNSKYKNIRCEVHYGEDFKQVKKFPSLKEGRRFADLLLLEQAGEIFMLKTQVNFELKVNGQLVCKYRADFTYFTKGGKYIVEDSKGAKTREYLMKKRLLFLTQGIEILET